MARDQLVPKIERVIRVGSYHTSTEWIQLNNAGTPIVGDGGIAGAVSCAVHAAY